MYVFMPQKDMLLLLTQYAKKFVRDFNSRTDKAHYIFQIFPLYAFFENEIALNNIKNCTIYAPQKEENKYFFPVMINDIKTKIIFAQNISSSVSQNPDITQSSICLKNKSEIYEQCDNIADCETGSSVNNTEQIICFPLNARVFRIGKAIIEKSDYNCSWQIFDDKWVKIKSESKN